VRRRVLALRAAAASVAALAAASAFAAEPSGGGSLPLADVIERMKRYPNLVQQIKLELVRVGLKREAVVCSGQRFGREWKMLGGERTLPYRCELGRRRLAIDGQRVYLDAAGKRLEASDPKLTERAARVLESRITWVWR